MAQSSAAREPTMEEILASIRRIIESNDAPQPDETRPALSSVPGGLDADVARMRSEPPVAVRRVEEDDEEMAPVLREDAAAPAVSPANDEMRNREEVRQDEAKPARAISLADVAARLRCTPQPSLPAAEAPIAPQTLAEPALAEDDDAMAAARNEDVAPPIETTQELRPDVRQPRMAGLSLPLEPRQPAREVPDNSLPAERDHSDFDARTDEAPSHEPAAAQANGGSALMSSTTGAQVAAAFDDLSDVMRKGPMRSFDEIAEDMLRPMLRDWLDDNLPTLVERLVREEIERVARGGRR